MKKLSICALLAVGCSQGAEGNKGAPATTTPTDDQLLNRAYIVSRESDDLTVIDLTTLEIVGNAKLNTMRSHMADVSADLKQLMISSTGSGELVFVDTRNLKITDRRQIGNEPTHITVSPSGDIFSVMLEKDNAVELINTATHEEVKRLEGFLTPHFLRFTSDGKQGYVANLGGYTVTHVDLEKYEIDGQIAVEGYGAGQATRVAEGGFADAQIDENGMMYAAHAETGRVLIYDTKQRKLLPNLSTQGEMPWIVFADHHFPGLVQTHLVPNLISETVSLIDGVTSTFLGTVPGDREAYGVNYTPLAPDTAFVMNRVRENVSVVNIKTRQLVGSIAVGGNTETASTTRDGKYIVATVSSANRVVVIDAVTQQVVKTFENVGSYPWSVVIPGGQNYCH